MLRTISLSIVSLALAGLLAGCGAGDALWGASMAGNAARKDSHLKIQLDGQIAKQNFAKKAVVGYSRFDIKERVGTTPKLQFEIQDPDKFGRITGVSIQIHQKFEADYSDHAEFVISARKQESTAQMRPGVVYDLGNLGPDFRIMDFDGKDVPAVTLKPGMKYMLVLTVMADKSETANIYFETK
jgi:hypothetical protein